MNIRSSKRTMRHPERFVGKRVDSTRWLIPDGYVQCAFTGKLCREDDALVTFDHWAFSREERLAMRIWHVEDASWLSEEGYDAILAVLETHGKLDYYLNHAF